jgi:protein-tyrosine sulfotransferase
MAPSTLPRLALDRAQRRVFRIGENRSLRGRRNRTKVSWYLGETARSDAPGIVLGGAMRSGTTLARVILDSHPDIACGPESQLFCGRFEEFGLSRKFDVSRRSIRMMERESDHLPAFIERFLGEHARAEGAKLWAEKTPGNVHNMGWTLDRFPNVVFVHVIRDGRGVVNSIRTWPRHRYAAGRLIPNMQERDLDRCIEMWLRAVTPGLRFAGHPRVMELRYEDLVHDPEAALSPLLARFDLRWDPRMSRHHEVQTPSRDPRRFPSVVEAAAPIDRSAVERWRSELTDDQILEIERRGRAVLVRTGYLPAPTSATSS